ncbi:hypothetical protein [Flavobacterium ustbae]|uniref:hypothetical protein n=1 Tax=Flavobacterium ustbae TaxID=2488790 RepID=UPI000F7AD2A0|nr:hypothetical protein [Flavobacterium ustbae]
MNNSIFKYLFLTVIFILITEVTNNALQIDYLLQRHLLKILSLEQANSYISFHQKWYWLTYLFIPIIIFIKISIITVTLHVCLLLSARNLKFSKIWNIVLNAEFLFLFVFIFKIIWFLFFQSTYTLSDVQNFYPLSALNIVGYNNLEPWYIYPLQTLNLFEFAYIIYIGFQIGQITNTNTDYGLKIVAISYVPTLLLWIVTVMFFTLNYS